MKTRLAKVVRKNDHRTLRVEVQHSYFFPKYKKTVTRKRNWLVDYSEQLFSVKKGDTVRIAPLSHQVSKKKSWSVLKVEKEGLEI